MDWKLPEDWALPENEQFYLQKKNDHTIYTATKANWDRLSPHLLHTRVALDIGSHIGTTVLRYAKHFETVHAFEPVYYELLETNIKHLDNVIVHPVAASNETNTIYMRKSNKNSGCTLIKTESNKRILKDKRFNKKDIVSKCIPVDSLNIINVDFIKIDTEGFVLPVLQGLIKTIKQSNYPILLIEFNSLCSNTQECVNFVQDLGYTQFDQSNVDRFYKHEAYK
jgi:FkbM family methyltransferase